MEIRRFLNEPGIIETDNLLLLHNTEIFDVNLYETKDMPSSMSLNFDSSVAEYL